MSKKLSFHITTFLEKTHLLKGCKVKIDEPEVILFKGGDGSNVTRAIEIVGAKSFNAGILTCPVEKSQKLSYYFSIT